MPLFPRQQGAAAAARLSLRHVMAMSGAIHWLRPSEPVHRPPVSLQAIGHGHTLLIYLCQIDRYRKRGTPYVTVITPHNFSAGVAG